MSATIDPTTELDHLLATAVQDDKDAGIFRCRRDIFTNEALYALEMKHIFEGNWIYLAHESQIPNVNDYYTTHIGRQPVFIARNSQGELNAFVNACTHRGAMLCRHKRGNKATYTCPFHGWTFNNSGKLLKVKDPEDAGYPECFNKEGSHDLKKVARFESYRGFLFGSLSDDVLPLEDYLGDARVIIDMIVDQSTDGLEVLRGNSSYIYEGNWKMQMENGCDGYHVSTVHWNYAATMGRRKEDGTKAVDANGWSKSVAGVYGFDHGHILLWTKTMNPEVRPVYRHRDEIAARVGAVQADFIVNQTRNLCLYPNVYLMDQFGSQIRVLRPLAVDKTEVSIFCFAPKGESDADRATRIRQYEDFFNVSGMGTADDLEEFRACQAGYAGSTAMWNDLSRGAPLWIDGPDENAAKMGLNPRVSGERSEDEGLFVCQHEYWVRVMRDALQQERGEAQA
ncbi:Rieske 2Fe-2S domain-containing protein [Burkholderia ubonensis]|uniref:Benzoate 1,2-dioxygenase large subunit n=1 Tax=Burkholderia ubonensis TaxID=101571 RepID=A0A1B4LI66_9BURK|nr:Rieske 2Fe-2S domain-containing protein [Burkholderia ubonensis]AOJ76815.1 benzoate 1,2-dioxygenase large subunit [Burkholderia ubonensis]